MSDEHGNHHDLTPGHDPGPGHHNDIPPKVDPPPEIDQVIIDTGHHVSEPGASIPRPEAHSLTDLSERHLDSALQTPAHPLPDTPGIGVFGAGIHLASTENKATPSETHQQTHDADYAALHHTDAGAHDPSVAAGELAVIEHEPPSGAPLEPLASPLGADAVGEAIHDTSETHDQAATALWTAFARGEAATGTDGNALNAVEMLERLAHSVADPYARDVIETALADARAAGR